MISDEPRVSEDIQILIGRVLSEVERYLGREKVPMEYQAQLALSNIANNDLTEYKIIDQDACEVQSTYVINCLYVDLVDPVIRTENIP